PWLLAWQRSAALFRPQAAACHCCRLCSLPEQQAHRPLSPNCDPTWLCCRCCSLPLAFISPGEPNSAIASPAGSAHLYCGFRRLWCLYLSSSPRWSPTWWLISWQASHESKTNHSCCFGSYCVWICLLLLWRQLDAQRTAASGAFFFGRPDAAEERV